MSKIKWERKIEGINLKFYERHRVTRKLIESDEIIIEKMNDHRDDDEDIRY